MHDNLIRGIICDRRVTISRDTTKLESLRYEHPTKLSRKILYCIHLDHTSTQCFTTEHWVPTNETWAVCCVLDPDTVRTHNSQRRQEEVPHSSLMMLSMTMRAHPQPVGGFQCTQFINLNSCSTRALLKADTLGCWCYPLVIDHVRSLTHITGLICLHTMATTFTLQLLATLNMIGYHTSISMQQIRAW